MIKIVSGWSNPGGSTTAFILLTNLLNDYGFDCCFYGPHKWHLDKTKANHLKQLKIYENDICIFHFLNIPKVQCRKQILSSHEQDIFPLQKIDYTIYDKIHYVSEHQKDYHKVNHPHFIIPNVLPKLTISKNPKGIYGVIGSIDRNKQVHVSIEKALADGAKKVLIYGNITDYTYCNEKIKPLVDKYKNVEFLGHCEDKQSMCDSVERVYQDSELETWGYIKVECLMTGTQFFGSEATNNIEIWNNERILKAWIKELEL